MNDLEETNALLREIRDHLAASEGRYDRATAENKRIYQEYLAKTQRRALIAAAIIGVGLALVFYGTR